MTIAISRLWLILAAWICLDYFWMLIDTHWLQWRSLEYHLEKMADRLDIAIFILCAWTCALVLV